jgi:hypothetical protein
VDYERLRTLLSALLEIFGSPLSATLIFFPQLQRDWGEWSPWGRFLRLKQQVDDLIYDDDFFSHNGDKLLFFAPISQRKLMYLLFVEFFRLSLQVN